MFKNVAPMLIVLAVVFSGIIGIFLLSNQKSPANNTDINFNALATPNPTSQNKQNNATINNQTVTPTTAQGATSENMNTSPTGLKYQDEVVGNGKEVKSGDTVTVNYVGTLENGTKFDSSYDRKTPFTTQIGVGQVIKGWDEGIVGMKVGGKRKLIIPSDLGYGAQGAGNMIPPNSTLIFEVELLDAK